MSCPGEKLERKKCTKCLPKADAICSLFEIHRPMKSVPPIPAGGFLLLLFLRDTEYVGAKMKIMVKLRLEAENFLPRCRAVVVPRWTTLRSRSAAQPFAILFQTCANQHMFRSLFRFPISLLSASFSASFLRDDASNSSKESGTAKKHN